MERLPRRPALHRAQRLTVVSGTISVRAVRASDAGAVARLTHQLGYEMSPGDAAARLSRIIAKPDHYFLIAETPDAVVGWLHASLTEHIDTETSVVIEGLVVDRDHRRRGIGETLLGRAEAWGRERGCSIVRLRSASTRTQAHRFYERLGYTVVKTQVAFAKGLTTEGQQTIARLSPRVDDEKA